MAESIAQWLGKLGLGRYAQAFADNGVELDHLPHLTDDDLKELGLPLGPRRHLQAAVQTLSANQPSIRPSTASAQAAGARPLEAERRQLTVLFVDLVGSTELAARLDPEDMGAVMRAYHGACAATVERWSGHVAKYMGDGVLAYFGWPKAHEDEAERAVRAGLELTEAVAKLALPASESLAARIGIATGLVMVGELIGEGAAKEQTVVGETPNLAARLQTLAAPGSVVISQSTRRLVGGLFELDDLGPLSLKGFAEPLAAWKVEGEGRAEGRFEALHGERLTPLVGRAHELGILLERWAWSKDGDGQVVFLSGEPGIGKSRLIRALRERLGDEPYTPLSHYCSPYHTNSALYPVIGLLERAAQLDRATPPEMQLARLEAALAPSCERLEDVVPLLASLLGVPTGNRYPALALTPEMQKRRTLQALVDQLAGLAARQPVLALYEDVHWIDPSTLELLGLVIERTRQLPVLALITFRPEFQPPWSGQAHVTSLTMSRLGRRQGADLVARVTGAKPLPATIVEQIVARTDGVPLFVEELTKTVLESELLADAGDHYELSGPLPPLAIPTTLHDSLMARLDRLAPVKKIAQIGAVIGREFSHELVAAVSSLSEADLNSALDQLVIAQLIFRRGTPPEATYSFKHALVQDAAYQSLLKSRRQQLHGHIARVLEDEFPDTPHEVLAHHFTEAGLDEKAVGRWYAAGQSAAQRSAYQEGAGLFQRGLEVLKRTDDAVWCVREEIRLNNAIGAALLPIRGAVSEVEEAFARARQLSREVNEPQQLSRATHGLWLVSFRQADFETAVRLSREMLIMVENEQDTGLILQAHHAMWTTSLFRAELESGRHHTKIGVGLYRAEEHHHVTQAYGDHDAGVCCRYTRALILWLLGYPDAAVVALQDGLALAHQLRHPNSLALALDYASVLHRLRREPATAQKYANALVDLATEHGLSFRAAGGIRHAAWFRLVAGRTDEALGQIDQGLAIAQTIGSKLWHSDFLTLLAEACLSAGRHDQALVAINMALDFVRDSGERWWEAEIHRLRGELLLARRVGGLGEAEDSFRRALRVARTQSARSLELRAATSFARLWADRGKRAKARDLLAPVYGWFTEGFDTADLKDAKALLDELA
jgi:class 3 adenylate cyclase/predicted ATPase